MLAFPAIVCFAAFTHMLVAGVGLAFRERMKRKWLLAVKVDTKLFLMAWEQKRVEAGVHTAMEALSVFSEQTSRKIEMSRHTVEQTVQVALLVQKYLLY
jgi:hypothetical protein